MLITAFDKIVFILLKCIVAENRFCLELQKVKVDRANTKAIDETKAKHEDEGEVFEQRAAARRSSQYFGNCHWNGSGLSLVSFPTR